MAFTDGTHIELGGLRYRLDQSEIRNGIMPYRHYSQSLFPDQNLVVGSQAQRNLRQDLMQWQITNFDGGEGYKVLDSTDDDAGRRFYRSEGIDYRTPGQMQLNPSTQLQKPALSGATNSSSLASTFSNVTGTAVADTTTSTSMVLQLEGDAIASQSTTPGASTHQVDFFARILPSPVTTIDGVDLVEVTGPTSEGASWKSLNAPGAVVKSTQFAALDTSSRYDVSFYVYAPAPDNGNKTVRANVSIVRQTDQGWKVVVESGAFTVTDTQSPTAASRVLSFSPNPGQNYQARVEFVASPGNGDQPRLRVTNIDYSMSQDPADTVTIAVYHGSTLDTSSVVALHNTTSALIGTLTYTAAAATAYTYRITYTDGHQKPIVDSVTDYTQSSGTTVYLPDCIGLGQGGNVWLMQGASAVAAAKTFTYNFTTEAWTERTTVTTGTATGVSMCHTDKYEYFLTSDKIIWQTDTSTLRKYVNATTATGRGICITQNRLFLLQEDSTNGVKISTYAVDSDVSGGVISPTTGAPWTVTTALNTPDATARQRIVGTPQGAVFFINYANVNAEIWLADATADATTGMVTRKLADMEPGVKLTSIAYTAGLTFLAGQYLAETGHVGRSGLWILDVNNIPQRLGYLRRDDPDPGAPLSMQAYESDLWITQGDLIWRYSIISGGLFNEAEINNATSGGGRGIAVLQGRSFVANNPDGVWVTGSVSDYRQSGIVGSNRFQSSAYDFALPGKRKLLRSIQLLTDALDDEAQVVLEYQLDGDGTWHTAGVASQTGSSQFTFLVSTEDDTVTFGSLQIAATLQSLDGTATPVIKAINVDAFLNEDQEFFQLRLICEDPADSDAPSSASGGELARNLWALHNSGSLATLIDGYDESSEYDAGPSYLTVLETIEQQNTKVGDGIAIVTLRVVGQA